LSRHLAKFDCQGKGQKVSTKDSDTLIISTIILIPEDATVCDFIEPKNGISNVITQTEYFKCRLPRKNEMLALTNSKLAIKFTEKELATLNGFKKSWSSEAIDKHLRSLLGDGIFDWGSNFADVDGFGWRLLYKEAQSLVCYDKDPSEISGTHLSICGSPGMGKSWEHGALYFGETRATTCRN
jgi:hypothetical protein